ncbi:sulfite exporter TauE/SafE family protein [Thalassococcus sp. S3]|uniref:sulfite exporter TauE/SafE family protein n=1 Tax=Thalassococcus sp. S3 TaxID=2017482 RepID=UPI0010246852|nr:sulfite exporter TauE/SafE family protein [Thalassococcus sp. S3]QBF30023.1 hypothetical protein CFI11_02135 [Thalassococcus sp. S3]
MDALFPFLDPVTLSLTLIIAVLAGLVKGLVGFAMPMVMVAGMGTFLAPDLALAGLILPTLVTNAWQALGQGARAAMASIVSFRIFLGMGLVTLLATAQLFRFLPADMLFLLIGGPITLFALVQLVGVQFVLKARSKRVEAAIGAFAGAIGGVSGVWGPPTVAYLTALNTEKSEQMRVQGVIYGLGAVALLAAHIGSGVMRSETAPFSLLLVMPALAGMWVGGLIRGRADQQMFRRMTLFVLLIAGLNLVRRGLIG